MNENTIRVLHVVGGLDRGGVETWLMHVLRRVDRRRLQMDFLVHGTQQYAYEREAIELGARVIRCLHPHNPLSYGASLYRILSGQPRYDIVHSHVHFLTGFILRIARLAEVPHRIAHSHSNTNVIDGNSGLARRLEVRISRRWLNNSATQCLAVSSGAATALFGSEAKCAMLPCGIDLTPFHGTADAAEMRRQLGLPPNVRLVGHIGRFEPPKNHRMLVQIAAEVAKRDPNVHFVLIGEGPLRPEIEAMARASACRGSVHFLGARGDVPGLMKCMDAFILPSLYEGLPLAILEAQAAGLRCLVSTGVPSTADVVPSSIQRLSLEAGMSTWAERIISILRSSDECLSREKALSVVEQSAFNIENNVKRLLDIYRII